MADYEKMQYNPACHWVVCEGSDIPGNAVAGGDDKGGEVTYVGRVLHEGELLPGKVVRSLGACFVTHAGLEYSSRDYQALVCRGASLAWRVASDGDVPSGAIQGGVTASGEPLYIGRAHHEGLLIIGKLHPSSETMYVPYNKKEYGYAQYEVLTLKTLNL
ncbi:natterin-3-like isoform X2 [Dermacentor albipictus]